MSCACYKVMMLRPTFKVPSSHAQKPAVQVVNINPVSGTCYDVTMLQPTFKVPFSHAQMSGYRRPSEWNVLRRYDVTTYFRKHASWADGCAKGRASSCESESAISQKHAISLVEGCESIHSNVCGFFGY